MAVLSTQPWNLFLLTFEVTETSKGFLSFLPSFLKNNNAKFMTFKLKKKWIPVIITSSKGVWSSTRFNDLEGFTDNLGLALSIHRVAQNHP